MLYQDKKYHTRQGLKFRYFVELLGLVVSVGQVASMERTLRQIKLNREWIPCQMKNVDVRLVVLSCVRWYLHYPIKVYTK